VLHVCAIISNLRHVCVSLSVLVGAQSADDTKSFIYWLCACNDQCCYATVCLYYSE